MTTTYLRFVRIVYCISKDTNKKENWGPIPWEQNAQFGIPNWDFFEKLGCYDKLSLFKLLEKVDFRWDKLDSITNIYLHWWQKEQLNSTIIMTLFIKDIFNNWDFFIVFGIFPKKLPNPFPWNGSWDISLGLAGNSHHSLSGNYVVEIWLGMPMGVSRAIQRDISLTAWQETPTVLPGGRRRLQQLSNKFPARLLGICLVTRWIQKKLQI